MIDLEFIQRCQGKEFQEVVKDTCYQNIYRNNKWQRENPEKQREHVRKYSRTEKGKIASRRSTSIGHMRIRDQAKELDEQEKEMIRSFYANRPDGYHVDHIIPLCRGGTHTIDNLQYLTPHQNMYKGRMILWFYLPEYIEKEKHLIYYTIFVRSIFYLN